MEQFRGLEVWAGIGRVKKRNVRKGVPRRVFPDGTTANVCVHVPQT